MKCPREGFLSSSPAPNSKRLDHAQLCCFGAGYTPLQASLVAQMVKNPPATWETWV